MVPKLVAEDIPLLHSLLTDVFPGVKYRSADVGQLKAEIAKVCTEMHLMSGDVDSAAGQWLEKVSSPFPLFTSEELCVSTCMRSECLC